MNRRNFVLSASATLALTSQHVFAQRSTRSANVMTSELTGGEVDLSGTTLELLNQHIDDADGSEHFHFAIENEGQFDIYFWPQKLADSGEYVQWYADQFMAALPGEVLGSEDFGDGGYIAFNAFKLGYYEFQRNAYPGHDIMIFFHADADIFEKLFNDAQAILIDGMPPFLYQEDSGIFDIAAAELEKTSSGTTGTTSRTARGSNTEKPQETTSSRSSRSATESSSSSSDNPVDAVIAHREAFWNSYTEFYDLLEAMAAEGASETEIQDSWALILNISIEWQNYPVAAAEIEFSTEQATLQGLYLDWADGVGLMGVTFEQYALEETTIDDVLDANDALAILDDALGAELGVLNSSFKPNRVAIALVQMRDRTKTLA